MTGYTEIRFSTSSSTSATNLVSLSPDVVEVKLAFIRHHCFCFYTRFICTMTSRAANWSLFYSNLPKNHDVNQKMAQIIGFNHFQLHQEDWISNLKQNPGLSMLLVNGFHDLILLHQVSFLHENLF